MMAEVSPIRSMGRPRPLGDVKDDISYMVHHDSRYGSSDSNYGRTEDIPEVRRMRDVKESLRHAALINIVAAVNESGDECHTQRSENEHPKSGAGKYDGGMNLVLHKDRTISIPKPQVFFEPPEHFSKKKPVFYKNSKDEVQDDMEHRKRCVSLTRTRLQSNIYDEENIKYSPRPKSESIQISVSLQQLKDELKTDVQAPSWIEKPSKVRIARSMSPRRRYMSLNKKVDTKSGNIISKCDAVDILDTTECLQNRLKPPTNTHIESYGQKRENTDNEQSSIYRARSLPSLFPVKKKREIKPTGGTSASVSEKEKDKTRLISPFKRPSASTYGGMPNMVMGKTIQVKSDSQDESVPEFKYGQKVTEKLQATISANKSETQSDHQKQAVLSLEGRLIPNPRQQSALETKYQEKRLLNRLQTGPDYLKMVQDKHIMRDLDHHIEELQLTLSQRDSHWNDNSSQNSVDIANYGLVGKNFNSKHSNKRISSSQRAIKRVTFAPTDEDDPGDDTKSTGNTLCEDRQNRARTKRAVSQIRSNSSTMKAISSGELSRLKKRIMPEQVSETKPRYDLVDNIRISGMSSRESDIPARPPSRMSDIRSMVSEGGSSYYGETVNDWNETEIDETDRTSSHVAKSYGASSFYPDSTKISLNFNHFRYNSDDDDDDSDDDVNETYRIVKAVDLGTLSGFQHRKFKKPSTKLETSTTHFIKIKVKG